MKRNQAIFAAVALSLIATGVVAQQPAPPAPPAAPPEPMRFFITSAPPGHGNLGGLAGADQICQNLAAAAGAGGRTWRAYLSTQTQGTTAGVNARDRIGTGPWHNQKGVRIAANVADLHGDLERDRNFVNKTSALDEKGNLVNGVGDQPNQHDILTGSDSLGRAWIPGEDRTCKNWTSDATTDRGYVGHHDRLGGGTSSWNSAHPSAGCDAPALVRTGGAGKFYCFAIN
jgi:hypothetical protein